MKNIRIFSFVLVLIAGGCGQEPADPPVVSTGETGCTPKSVSEVTVIAITPGLSSKTVTTGCGEAATAGQTAVVHYTGWLFDEEADGNRGNKFDSSRDRGDHFRFPLAAGRVIKGWDMGVVGMTVGEVRELTIAPELAYGDRDIGVIPPGSTLVFEVELADLESAQPAQASQ